jgi:hypothetical protein
LLGGLTQALKIEVSKQHREPPQKAPAGLGKEVKSAWRLTRRAGSVFRFSGVRILTSVAVLGPQPSRKRSAACRVIGQSLNRVHSEGARCYHEVAQALEEETVPLTNQRAVQRVARTVRGNREVSYVSVDFCETKPFHLRALPLRPQIRQLLRPWAEKRCLQRLGQPEGAGVRAGPCRDYALSWSRSGRALRRRIRLACIPNKGLLERGGFGVSHALKLSGIVRSLSVFLFVGYDGSRKIVDDRGIVRTLGPRVGVSLSLLASRRAHSASST